MGSEVERRIAAIESRVTAVIDAMPTVTVRDIGWVLGQVGQLHALLVEAVQIETPHGSILDYLPGEIEEPLRAWINGEPFPALWAQPSGETTSRKAGDGDG